MMIKINGQTIQNLKRGFILNERLDEELDSGTIIFYNAIESEYAPMSLVEVYIKNNQTVDQYFLINSDQVLLTSKDLNIYQHTITLIEPTKLLERMIVDNVAFTQPTNVDLTRYTLTDVLNRIKDITPLETSEKHTATRRFSFNSELLNEFNIKAPQFFFSNSNLFQVLAEIFKYRNSIPRIATYTNNLPVVSADDFNKVLNVINTLTGYNEKARSNNVENYVNKVETNIENGITEFIERYPANQIYAPLTTENFVMTTNDIMFILPKKIYKIKSLKILMNYRDTQDFQGEGGQQSYDPLKPVDESRRMEYRSVDLTSLLFEEQIFNTLPIDDPSVQSQRGSLVFKQGDNKIVGFGMAYPQFWGQFPTTTFEGIYNDIFSVNITRGTETHVYQNFLSNLSVGTFLLSGFFGFQVEYYPYVDQRSEVYRETPFNNNNDSLIVNQSGKAIDINRLLTNTQTTLDRMGNGDLVLEKSIKDYDDRFRMGQLTTDNYIVTSVETTIEENFFLSKAILTKNFNRLSQFVGVDREYRQYEIPFNETVKRNLLYSEYIILSTSITTDNNASYWTSSFITQFRNMFRNVEQPDDQITGFIFTTKDHNNNTIGNFLISVAKSYQKNSIIFHGGFNSNTVAFFYPIRKTTNFLEQLIAQKQEKRYTYFNNNNLNDIKNGTFEKMTLSLIGSDLKSFDLDSYLIEANTYLDALDHFRALPTSIKIVNGVRQSLYYKLQTPFTDLQGMNWSYCSIDADDTTPSNFQGLVVGHTRENTLKEIFYELRIDTANYTLLNKSRPIEFHLQQDISPDFINSSLLAANIPDLIVKKDPSEIISMTYQLHIVPKVSHIIIGETMAKNSPYLTNRFQLDIELRRMRLYRSTEYYRDGDTFARPSIVSAAFTNFTTEIIQHGFYIDVSASLTGYNSWAIADDLGNLYFGVNRKPDGTIDNRVFIQFKNKL
jgi:hypothetical protein